MADRNEWHGEGRLGRDPDLRYTKAGKPVCNFSVACSSKSGDKTYTEWINIVAWGDKAEWCASNLRKGTRVHILGSIHTSSYEKDGRKVYKTEVNAFNIALPDAKEKPKDAPQDDPGVDEDGQLLPF
jgi:single-strand DNA-binding protein